LIEDQKNKNENLSEVQRLKDDACQRSYLFGNLVCVNVSNQKGWKVLQVCSNCVNNFKTFPMPLPYGQMSSDYGFSFQNQCFTTSNYERNENYDEYVTTRLCDKKVISRQQVNVRRQANVKSDEVPNCLII